MRRDSRNNIYYHIYMNLLRYERSAYRARLVFEGRAKRICARVTTGTRGGKMWEKFEFQSGEKSRLLQLSRNRARSGNTSIYTYNIIITIYLPIYIGTIVWRDHVRFTYYYTWTCEYNIRCTYRWYIKILGIYLQYTRMALSMAFTRCKT